MSREFFLQGTGPEAPHIYVHIPHFSRIYCTSEKVQEIKAGQSGKNGNSKTAGTDGILRRNGNVKLPQYGNYGNISGIRRGFERRRRKYDD
ncbi:MAG: hypothetical protein ACSW8K_03285 [bacterium]